MQLVISTGSAAETLGISERELLRAVLDRRIQPPRKYFGYDEAALAEIKREFSHRKEN